VSLPLKRSEEPLNRSEELRETLTTADLAQPKRPASAIEELGPKAVRSERVATPASIPTESTENASLFSAHELDDLRNRWNTVQTGFVDQPRRAVEQADELVASAMQRLAEVFAEERSKLEKQWDRGDNVSTEDLRVALQHYRSFFQRLLSVHER
jgi:hypothetical protein